MPDALLAVAFLLGAALSLAASWVLVSRLERVGARLGLSEGLLGVLAALAADAPEITAAVTAIGGHESRIGAGVVIGSNVFNLAALLGFAAVLARKIALHRRVIVMEGVVALWIAAVCLAVIVGLLSPAIALGLVLAVLVPYVAVLGLRRDRLGRIGLPPRWIKWLMTAIVEEEIELEVAIHPRRGRARDSLEALAAVFVVVAASVAMEQTASELGARHAIPEIVVGGLILGGVTSLPNAVAAIYLAARGRGAATLSTAMNSNATVVGRGAASGQTTLVAAWYLGLTAFALSTAYISRGLRRGHGALIIAAYLSFASMVMATAYSSPVFALLSTTPMVVAAIPLAAWLLRDRTRRHAAPSAAEPHKVRGSLALGTSSAITPLRRAEPTIHPATNGKPIPPRPEDLSLLGSWSIKRVWYLALALSSLIATTDGILGPHVILIGLLIAGPCCALLTGRWALTATASAWAVALAVLLGFPDEIWGTTTHFAFLATVVIVAIVSTSSAAVIERRR
jgi:cation:H+ antiporter